MAPPRKKRRAPGETHPVHLRLPADVFERLEAKTKATGRPFNRVIINELAAFPDLEEQDKLGERVRDLTAQVEKQATLIVDMQAILARYGSRITLADLGEQLMQAVDDVLAAKPTELEARRDRLRVVRTEMLKQEKIAKE